jgi:hypothetical protein
MQQFSSVSRGQKSYQAKKFLRTRGGRFVFLNYPTSFVFSFLPLCYLLKNGGGFAVFLKTPISGVLPTLLLITHLGIFLATCLPI